MLGYASLVRGRVPATTNTQHRRCIQIPSRSYAFSPIQVLLTEDMGRTGLKGEVVPVKKGYARNKLLPRGLAVYPTPENRMKYPPPTKEVFEKIERQKELDQMTKKIGSIVIEFRRHVFPAGEINPVTKDMIVEKAWKQHRMNLDEEQIRMEREITALGQHSVLVQIIGADFTLRIDVKRR
eukprot:TRINITY_DN12524_c0_g1_i1.p2 TRINITY_DN12524_c0_g1~~TRINITY_DN12524_c0_g1_i1.p2  ORF type:complete len:181 (-),score=34.07 TRINITY_DN12524_c0_g1_i1:46-588(-)